MDSGQPVSLPLLREQLDTCHGIRKAAVTALGVRDLLVEAAAVAVAADRALHPIWKI
jgi:hypothetical protein